MVIISQYRIEKYRNIHYVYSEEMCLCPICSGSLKVAGSRKRKLIIDDGFDTLTLVIRRLRCQSCCTIHHELPDIVVPYKHHCTKTIEKMINGDSTEIYCENSTIRRIKAWWVACLLCFEKIIASFQLLHTYPLCVFTVIKICYTHNAKHKYADSERKIHGRT
jgi:hypothetical protein